ncbi:hypothetical protein RJ639_010864 [Escallonia herrerae]|uniref:K Homology domain-containing protein n=1 Tax=Escallonia herrerae TaxID=1293975 RepID=A0AA89AP97_9ASTE|nr:hypothetical protein RJ639_010864 [Escallonia herrerae]
MKSKTSLPVRKRDSCPVSKVYSTQEGVDGSFHLSSKLKDKANIAELKTRADTPDIRNLQRCADFVEAFLHGFEVRDAIALLRMDEIYSITFSIDDVKTLRRDHMSRAIGRLAGRRGKTKFAIENSTKTRIVIRNSTIYILGSYANIEIAKDAICSLILGSPAPKAYSKLRAVTARAAERF